VLFVDHDPARLADRVDQRWQLADGRVTVVAGGAQHGSRTRSGRTPAGPAPQAVTIEVTELEAASLERLARLVGVLGVAPDLAEALADRMGSGDAAEPLGPVRVSVSAAMSDAVLRELLSWDGVHVSAVGPAPEPPSPGRPRPGEAGRGAEASR